MGTCRCLNESSYYSCVIMFFVTIFYIQFPEQLFSLSFVLIFLIFCCWFFFFLLLKIGALCFSLNSIIFLKFILFIFFTFILLQCFGLFSTSSLFRALHSSCVSLTGKTNLKQPGKIKSASQTRAQQVDLTFLFG